MADRDRFTGKVAVVTGGASGIGAATAQLLAGEGARVVIGDVSEPAWAADWPGIDATLCDVRDADAATRLVRGAAETFGGLDILVNNAGTAGRLPRPPVENLPVADWDETLAINLTGTFHCSKAALPYLAERGGGAIVNNASMLGVVALPESAAYAASKGGVVQFTKALALEAIDHNIRVNCVCASFIDTPMFNAWLELQDDPEAARRDATSRLPINRLGTPEEVATAIAFLASDDASYVVGHALFVCGGYLAQ
jgi:meso-butanediol dehydrogenase / (S,S)-butanediol dehydrogenase / diacetyl reductase